MSDIGKHCNETVDGSRYGTVGDHSVVQFNHANVHVDRVQNHCCIRLNCGSGNVTLGRVENHTIITGTCASLVIGDVLENHSRICVTGSVRTATQDACEVQHGQTMEHVATYRSSHERLGEGTDV